MELMWKSCVLQCVRVSGCMCVHVTTRKYTYSINAPSEYASRLAQQLLDLRLFGGRLVRLAVGRRAALVGAVLQQHPHAAGVPLPDGGQQRRDAVLVHLLRKVDTELCDVSLVGAFVGFTYVHLGAPLQQVREHIGLAVVGGNVHRIALAHLGVHVERLCVADLLHLLQVAVLDGPHNFVHGLCGNDTGSGRCVVVGMLLLLG